MNENIEEHAQKMENYLSKHQVTLNDCFIICKYLTDQYWSAITEEENAPEEPEEELPEDEFDMVDDDEVISEPETAEADDEDVEDAIEAAEAQKIKDQAALAKLKKQPRNVYKKPTVKTKHTREQLMKKIEKGDF